MTEWRDIPGWVGYYQASDEGRVRSVDRVVVSRVGVHRPLRGMELKPKTDRRGYFQVALARNGACKSIRVHQLVALAFLGEAPFVGAVIRHLDGSKSNNAASNLKWGSQSENEIDAVEHGQNWNSNKKACPQGHPYEPGNTYVFFRNGRPARACRTCRRAASQRYEVTRERLAS